MKHETWFKNNEGIKTLILLSVIRGTKRTTGGFFFFCRYEHAFCAICLRPHVTVYTLWSNVATSHCFWLYLFVRLSTDFIPFPSFKFYLNFVAGCATVGLTSLLIRLSLRAAYTGSIQSSVMLRYVDQ